MRLKNLVVDDKSLRDYCTKWKISRLSVFGSVLREDFGPNSDIDFLAEYDPASEWDIFDHMDMEDELAVMVGRPVDVVGLTAVAKSRNAVTRDHILKTAIPIYV